MEELISYIQKTYQPLAVILYGSYADGSNNEGSDFDAMVITTEDCPETHDVGFVNGIQLDVFVYPKTRFGNDMNCEEMLAIYDGIIQFDTDEIANHAIQRVREYVHQTWQKPQEEIAANISWCRKMLLRSQRRDAEGMFRWHLMLVDSLEFACDVLHHPYFEPKKSLQWLEKNHPDVFEVYDRALSLSTINALEEWVDMLEKLQIQNR